MRYRVLRFVMRAEDDERAQKAYLHLDMREREKRRRFFFVSRCFKKKECRTTKATAARRAAAARTLWPNR